MSASLDHEWEPVSRHRTSDGVVSYLRCRCGSWRIRLAPAGGPPWPDGDPGDARGTLAEPVRGRRRAVRPR